MRVTLFLLMVILVGLVVLASALVPAPKGAGGAPLKAPRPAAPVPAPHGPAPAAAPTPGAVTSSPRPRADAPEAAAEDPATSAARAALRALGDFVMVVRGAPGAAADLEVVIVPGRIQVMFREGEGRSRLGGDLAPGSFAELLDQLSRLGFWGLPVESGSGSPASITVQAGERFWTSRPGGEVAVPRGPGGPAGDLDRRSFRAVLDAITLFAAEHATEPVSQEDCERAAGPLRRAGARPSPSPTGG